MGRRNLHVKYSYHLMKQFLFLSSFLLLCGTSTFAQTPCTAQELKSVHASADSPCEASQGNTPYYNFVTLSTIRNYVKTGTLTWQYRQDTVTGTWQNLSPAIWQDLGTDVITRADFTVADNGQYRCVFTDTATGCKDYRKVNVYVNPRPQISIGIDSIKCEGMYLGVGLLNDPTQTLTYCWQPDLSGQTNNCQGDQPAFLFDRAGCFMVSGIVTVKVTNQYGCENMVYTSGLCNLEYLDLSTRVNDEDSVFCAKSATLDVFRANTSLQAGWTYQWKRNGTNLSWATSPVIKPATSGTYSCLVTNNSGCTLETNPAAITVHPLPTVNLQPAGSTEICTNSTLILNAGSSAGNSFAWYRNNTLMAASADTLPVSTAGTYRVIATNAFGCTATSQPGKITVYRAKTTANGPTIFCAGDSVVLQQYTPNTVSWQWQLNNVNIPGATFPTYAAKQSGLYRAKSKSVAGCISYSNQIDISVNCRAAIETAANLQVYPVPSSDFIEITIPEEFRNHSVLLLTDISGKVLSGQDISGNTTLSVSIRHLDPGIYFIRLQSDNSAATGKIVRL